MTNSNWIVATPNPVPWVSGGPAPVVLSWHAATAAAVEVRVDAPDGPLFSASGPSGRGEPGAWLCDGTTFYMQDVSGGRPLAPAYTLATVIVGVQSPPILSRRDLAEAFRELGLSDGDTVMLHASVRAVGECAGGPDDIHVALREAIGAAGTLLMYTSAPWHYGSIGRGTPRTGLERSLVEKLPAYDPLTTRSARENGALVEMFRTWPGTVVSHGAARFAAAGARASSLVSDQPWDYPFGPGSPLDKLLECDGKILVLGADRAHVTFLHYVEHVADFPGKRITRVRIPVEHAGQRTWRDWEAYADPAHANWPDRFFATIIDGFIATTNARGGRVGQAEALVLPARDLFAYAAAVMQAVATGA